MDKCTKINHSHKSSQAKNALRLTSDDLAPLRLSAKILKIACDVFVQMHAVPARHVVPVPGVDEKVGVRARADRRFQELQAVLHHHYRIFVAVNDKQPRFQPAGFVQQARGSVGR